MRGIFRFLIGIVLTLLFACTPPIGNIAGGSGNTTVTDKDFLWAVPYRDAYNIFDLFVRYSDVSVFVSSRGLIHSIPVDSVEFFVVEDPDWENLPVPVSSDEYYEFKYPGRKVVVAQYGGLSSRYSIMVSDPYGLGSGEPGGPGEDEGGGIVVKWGCETHGLNPCKFCCFTCYKMLTNCRCRCKECGQYPCKCCPVCKAAPGFCVCGDCKDCGVGCQCVCPDCEQNPCRCLCPDCRRLLNDCSCCKICGRVPCDCCPVCHKFRCNCPLCPECGRQPRECLCCDDCHKYPCECRCPECNQLLDQCACCPDCGKYPCECP